MFPKRVTVSLKRFKNGSDGGWRTTSHLALGEVQPEVIQNSLPGVMDDLPNLFHRLVHLKHLFLIMAITGNLQILCVQIIYLRAERKILN